MTTNPFRPAVSRSFRRMDQALAYLDAQPVPIVVRPTGWRRARGGRGHHARDAKQAVRDAMEKVRLRPGGGRVLIEEFLDGEELDHHGVYRREDRRAADDSGTGSQAGWGRGCRLTPAE